MELKSFERDRLEELAVLAKNSLNSAYYLLHKTRMELDNSGDIGHSQCKQRLYSAQEYVWQAFCLISDMKDEVLDGLWELDNVREGQG